MASQNRPSSDRKAPDPARSYGREEPQAESGQGRLDNNVSTPTNKPDKMPAAAKNKQTPRQVNAHDASSQRSARSPEQSAKAGRKRGRP
jgi:hypothetical protein